MSAKSSSGLLKRVPRELPAHVAEDLAAMRALSLAERALMLEAVCAAAVDIHQARLKMGLPPIEPEPWPPSMLEFLRRHAPNGRKSAAN
jgi:hypothetical protein